MGRPSPAKVLFINQTKESSTWALKFLEYGKKRRSGGLFRANSHAIYIRKHEGDQSHKILAERNLGGGIFSYQLNFTLRQSNGLL
jgi:hypothetical protein